MERRGFLKTLAAALAAAGVVKATPVESAPVECIAAPEGFAPGGVLLTWLDKATNTHSLPFRPRMGYVEDLVSIPEDQVPVFDDRRTHVAVWVWCPDKHYQLRGIAPLCETYGLRDHFHESDIVPYGEWRPR